MSNYIFKPNTKNLEKALKDRGLFDQVDKIVSEVNNLVVSIKEYKKSDMFVSMKKLENSREKAEKLLDSLKSETSKEHLLIVEAYMMLAVDFSEFKSYTVEQSYDDCRKLLYLVDNNLPEFVNETALKLSAIVYEYGQNIPKDADKKREFLESIETGLCDQILYYETLEDKYPLISKMMCNCYLSISDDRDMLKDYKVEL